MYTFNLCRYTCLQAMWASGAFLNRCYFHGFQYIFPKVKIKIDGMVWKLMIRDNNCVSAKEICWLKCCC